MELFYTILVVLFAGFSSGLLGIGGGPFLTPFFLATKSSSEEAIATSLALMFLNSGISAFFHLSKVPFSRYRKWLWLFPPLILSSYLGALLVPFIPKKLLMFLFACLQLLFAFFFIQKRSTSEKGEESSLFFLLACGALSGLFSPLFGIGGGMIVLMLFTLRNGSRVQSLFLASWASFLGSSCALIPLNSAVDLKTVVTLLPISIVATLLGASLSHRLAMKRMHHSMGALFLIMALLLLISVFSEK